MRPPCCLSFPHSLSILPVLCGPPLLVLWDGTYFHPGLSASADAGWLKICIFHSLVTFPCRHSGSCSLRAAPLLTDCRLQISYGHSKWYKGSRRQGVGGGGGSGELEEGVKVKTGADLKWLQRQRRSVFICSDVDWGVIFYHACASLSALIVCNKLPAKSLQLQDGSGATESTRK